MSHKKIYIELVRVVDLRANGVLLNELNDI